MRPKLQSKRFDEDGNIRYDYVCELKEKSKRGKCKTINVNGNKLDKLLIEKIEQIIAPNNKICLELKKIINTKPSVNSESDEKKHLEHLYNKNQNDLERLIERIKYIDVELIDDINQQIKKIKKENEDIKIKLESLKSKEKVEVSDIDTAKLILDVIQNHFKKFDTLDIIEKRELLKLIIDSAVGEGDTVTINLLNSEANRFFF